jgi:23S rRNA (guanosine2251-2'-O)-methyltransferase
MNLICGINPVVEALHAGSRHFDRLLVVKGLRNRRVSEAIAQAGRLGIPLRFEARETLDRMAGGLPHQGLIAVVSAKPVVTMDAVLDEARTPALVLLLDGVEDPRNLGAILRTADAAGVDGVLLPERHSAGLSETVSRASAGGIEHVKVARIGNVAQAIDALKQRGVWVVGLDASGTERWDAVDYRRPIALVLGGEGRGIRRLVREHCDHLVSLPLFGHVGSLNVSVAAGIALYEVIRQRGAVPSHVRPIPSRPAAPARVVGPGHDDGEHDPGDTAAARAAYAPEGDDEGEVSSPAALAFDDPERPAWNTGPTVLEAVRGRGAHGGPRRPPLRRGKRRGPDGRRDGAPRAGGERHARGVDEGPADRPAGDVTPGGPDGGRPGKRRRGRKRKRGGPGPGGPDQRPPSFNGEPGMAPEDAERTGDAMPEGPSTGPSGGEPGAPGPRPGRRGRRRRRRRH